MRWSPAIPTSPRSGPREISWSSGRTARRASPAGASLRRVFAAVARDGLERAPSPPPGGDGRRSGFSEGGRGGVQGRSGGRHVVDQQDVKAADAIGPGEPEGLAEMGRALRPAEQALRRRGPAARQGLDAGGAELAGERVGDPPRLVVAAG